MRVFAGPEALKAAVGSELGVGDWVDVDQAMIDGFARATDDFQWIHVDAERAARESPFGRTIAHGYLTLSLVPRFVAAARTLEGVRVSLNYGLERVRFPAPVPVGSRLRGRVTLVSCADAPPAGVRAQYGITVEMEGSERPACVAEAVVIHRW